MSGWSFRFHDVIKILQPNTLLLTLRPHPYATQKYELPLKTN